MTGLYGLSERPSYVGRHITRRGDDRLLSGQGSYIADMDLPEMLELTMVRSQLAHARIVSIDVSDAIALNGVLSAITAADLTGIRPFPNFIASARSVNYSPLAADRVRYVGVPFAAIVATDRYIGEDAAELVRAEFEGLPAVTSAEYALADDAPLLYEDWPNNRLFELAASSAEVDQIFARSSVVQGRYVVGRHTGVPLETRGCVASYDEGRLTLWTSNQHPHIARTTLSYVLPIQESDIRVIAPDVGGGFGPKQGIYPEDVLVSWFAMKLGRPVRYVEDRLEHMVATGHARDEIIDIEAAVDDEGQILALRAHIFHDVGSGEGFPAGFAPSLVTAGHMTGPYRIPAAAISVTAFVTNKTPSNAYRGYGVPEAVFALERLVEKGAEGVGVDPLEARRRMLIEDADLPYTTAGGGVLDSGSFREAFERAVELGLDSKERATATLTASQRDHCRIGLGLATYREGTAATHFTTSGNWTGQEACSMRVEPDGGVTVSVGMTDQGQGTETFISTLAADALGVPIEQVRVVAGDTDLCPYGLGAWASRQAVVGGGAILTAAARVRKKALLVAGHLLEADPKDLVVADGRIFVEGSEETGITMAEVGRAVNIHTFSLPPGVDPGIDVTATYEPETLEHIPQADGRINAAAAWTNATQAAIVRVDIETGHVDLIDYIVVHDCGRIINPTIVDGQVVGGVAQGIGGALYEDLPFTEDGQPLATTFMDYLLPASDGVPHITVEHMESPSPTLPLGMKGVGEGGTCGSLAAIANAVADALRDLGVDITQTPITPPRLWRLIQVARQGRGNSRSDHATTIHP